MSEWQTIESAPKDGKRIDLHGKHKGSMLGCDYRVVNCTWGYVPTKSGLMVEKDWIDINARVVSATHWMPLPQPPKDAE